MTDRPDASSITDDQLDQLYAERDQFADRVDTLTAVAKSNKQAHHGALEEIARLESAHAADTADGQQKLEDLFHRISAAHMLHSSIRNGALHVCRECSRPGGELVLWPCDTVRILNGGTPAPEEPAAR